MGEGLEGPILRNGQGKLIAGNFMEKLIFKRAKTLTGGTTDKIEWFRSAIDLEFKGYFF